MSNKLRPDDILQEVKENQWLFNNIFWPLMKYLIRDEGLENEKNNLKWLWFKDVEEAFDINFNHERFESISRIVFRIMWVEQEQKSGRFTSNKNQNE